MISLVQSNLLSFEHANKRVIIRLKPACSEDKKLEEEVQEVFYRILPLTLVTEISLNGDQAVFECEFESSSDCVLASEILAFI